MDSENAAAWAFGLLISRYMMGAGLTVMVYDWLLTYSGEIRFVWPARGSAVKLIFLFNRYIMPLTIVFAIYAWSGEATWLTRDACQIYIAVDSFVLLAFFFTLKWIIAMRTWVLYQCSAWVGVLIWGPFLCAATLTIFLISVATLAIDVTPVPGLNVCAGPLPDLLWMIWLPCVAYDAIPFIFLVAKRIQRHRHPAGTSSVSSGLYPDEALYFTFFALNSAANMVTYLLAPDEYKIISRYFTTAVCAIAACHLTYNLIVARHVHTHPESLRRKMHGGSISSMASTLNKFEWEWANEPQTASQTNGSKSQTKTPTRAADETWGTPTPLQMEDLEAWRQSPYGRDSLTDASEYSAQFPDFHQRGEMASQTYAPIKPPAQGKQATSGYMTTSTLAASGRTPPNIRHSAATSVHPYAYSTTSARNSRASLAPPLRPFAGQHKTRSGSPLTPISARDTMFSNTSLSRPTSAFSPQSRPNSGVATGRSSLAISAPMPLSVPRSAAMARTTTARPPSFAVTSRPASGVTRSQLWGNVQYAPSEAGLGRYRYPQAGDRNTQLTEYLYPESVDNLLADFEIISAASLRMHRRDIESGAWGDSMFGGTQRGSTADPALRDSSVLP